LSVDPWLYLVPPVFALAGVVLTEALNLWKRRERYKGLLFDKKLDFYQSLMAKTGNITLYLEKCGEDEPSPDRFAQFAFELTEFFHQHDVLASRSAIVLFAKFAITVSSEDIKFEEKKIRLGALSHALRQQCRKELGLEALEKDLAKMK
jgi:hypothetical protein